MLTQPRATTVLLICLLLLPQRAYSQVEDCINKIDAGLERGMWDKIKDYFETLSPTANSADTNLLQLRAEIITFLGVKKRLIKIIEEHIGAQTSGSALSEDLRLKQIPSLLAEIDSITQKLRWLAKEGNLFAAEISFKHLWINMDAKRTTTLCHIALQAALPKPDIAAMTKLAKDLKDEVTEIEAAEEALAKFVKDNVKESVK